MPDASYLFDLFSTINDSVETILERTANLNSENDFTNAAEGRILLDAVSMRLHFIGETRKKVERHDPSFLKMHSHINWDQIIRLRDFISHHYELIDKQII